MSGPSVQKSVRVSRQDDEFLRANGIVFAKLVKKAITDLRREVESRETIAQQNEATTRHAQSLPGNQVRPGDEPGAQNMAAGAR
jgi:hypothetical protein